MSTRTRSTRALTLLATLMLVLSIAFGVFLLVGALAGFGPNGHEVGVHTEVAAEQISDLPDGVVPADDGELLVRVPHATDEQLRWAAARDLTPIPLVAVGAWLLLRLLKSVQDGDPFTVTNVKRLRVLAGLILIGAPLAAFIASVCASELATSAGLRSSGVEVTMPGAALIGGLGALVLAEVFAGGVRMRDDLEGTV